MSLSKLENWSEERFIAFLKTQFSSPERAIGIGDDCAVICKGSGFQLITTDALVEDVHFLMDFITPENLGFKAIAVNVSDIAAMGGKPESAFLTLALPKSLNVQWLKNFMRGIKLACERYEIHLLGGDTVGSSHSIFINLTLLGSAKKIKLRSSAKIGDTIAVTGFLGDSLAGFELMKLNMGPKFSRLVEAHTTPDVYPEQGQWLASKTAVHAMMDISDGLDSDIRKILNASNCGAIVNTEDLPISDSLKKASQFLNWNPIEKAATGGEDYALLCTVAAKDFPKISKEFEKLFSVPLYAIGKITESGFLYQKNGQPIQLKISSYSHFNT